MTLTLARDLHNACPRCPQPTWHGPSGCPLWGAAKERERGVPCCRCRRLTWRNDQFCDRCAASGLRATAGDGSAAVTRSFSPAGAFVDALHQPPAGDLHP